MNVDKTKSTGKQHITAQYKQGNSIILQSATQTIPATINLRKSCDVPVEDAQLATNAIQRRHNQGPAVGLKQVLLQREVTTVEVLELPREEFWALEAGCEIPLGWLFYSTPKLKRVLSSQSSVPELTYTAPNTKTPLTHSYLLPDTSGAFSQSLRYTGLVSTQLLSTQLLVCKMIQLIWWPWRSFLLCGITAAVNQDCKQEHWRYHATETLTRLCFVQVCITFSFWKKKPS